MALALPARTAQRAIPTKPGGRNWHYSSGIRRKLMKKRLLRFARFLITWTSVAYVLALALVLYGLEHCTERQWLFGALLYLPPMGWLLPLAVLLPMAVMLRPSVCILHIAAATAVFFLYIAPHSLEKKVHATSRQTDLTVITANIGQRNVKTLQPFLESHDFDVIAFQERAYNPGTLAAQHPDYNVRVEKEFTLASKLPINGSGIVPDLEFQGRPVAAWFELDFHGQFIVVYDVHMPTPRSYLWQLRGNGFWVGLRSGGGLIDTEGAREYEYYWTTRFELARGLLTALEQEKRPMLVVGDFNTPAHGGLYRLLAANLTDSFAVAGDGGGETFPESAGRLSRLGPWMRLDYLFAGKDWIPLACEVEPRVRAQHLAVAGRYTLMKTRSEVAAIPAR
jgi:vancomycin resistance protein VanJ